jgi:hypothetical protein
MADSTPDFSPGRIDTSSCQNSAPHTRQKQRAREWVDWQHRTRGQRVSPMETTTDKSFRVSICLAVVLVSALCFVAQIIGAIYWTATGHIWAAIGSLFIPLFGAVSIVNAMIAS